VRTRVLASSSLACALVASLLVPTSALAQPRAPAPAAAAAAPAAGPRTAEDLSRARILDQQGAKAYGDGRYNDAIRYFEESHRLGGPPFELWNIAKCYVRLDQPEQAADMLEHYLATSTLPADDREEATQQLDGLRRRTSTVTVASQPSGAIVALDGRVPPESNGRTPTSFMVQPGQHTITLTAPKHAVYTQTFDARYGRAIIMDVQLKEAGQVAGPAANPYGDGEVRRIALRGDVGVMLPRYGSVGGAAHPTLTASGTYRFADVGATTFAGGAMLLLTGDSWDNTVAAPTTVAPCGALKNPRSDTALSMFVMGTAGWEIAPRWRVHAIAGLGLAAIVADDLGGDVFVSACKPSPGPRPAIMFGGQLDYALTSVVRLSALPILLQLQPAFEGTRSLPIDTSGVWMRATIAVGAGVDL
jgi:hypothetical protein